MAQLTVYLDEATLSKIELAAKQSHVSISQWVKERLAGSLHRTWPEGYFTLFGSLSETRFERPRQPSLSKDARREPL